MSNDSEEQPPVYESRLPTYSTIFAPASNRAPETPTSDSPASNSAAEAHRRQDAPHGHDSSHTTRTGGRLAHLFTKLQTMNEEEREAHVREQAASEERLKAALGRRDKDAADAVTPLSRSALSSGFYQIYGGAGVLDDAMEESSWSLAQPAPSVPGRYNPRSPSAGSSGPGSRSPST